MKNARPIGIRNCAQISSGSWKSSSQSVRLPVGRNSGVARAQRPAALAHAHDLALVEVEHVPVVARHGRRAEVAALARRRPPEPAPAPWAARARAGRRPSGPARRSSQRDPDLLLLAQQRDRLELEVVVVHRAARLRQEVAAPAARAARAHRRPARRRPACRRSPRRCCGRRAASRPRSRRTAARRPRRRRRPTRAARCSSVCQPGAPFIWTSGSGIPLISGASSTTPSTSMPSRSGAASSSAWRTASSSVDDDARHDLQLPSRRSFATPSSIPSSSTLPPCDSM